jgi:hypothetical protein
MPQTNVFGPDQWPVRYAHTAAIDVQAIGPSEEIRDISTSSGTTTVEALISDPPETVAAQRLIKAVNQLVGSQWLL